MARHSAAAGEACQALILEVFMTNRLRTGIEQGLDIFGWMLIRLVARLARPAYLTQGTRPQPVRRFLARRAIDGIVTVGRVVDRLNGYPDPRTDAAPLPANRPVLFTR